MRTIAFIAWIAGVLLGLSPASAEKRVALVIGNAGYQNVAALPNPLNDASDIGASLTRLGFAVTTLNNARYDQMRRAILSFGQQARSAEMAVVFFAGHGLETNGENWLIPVDAELKSDMDVESEAIGLKTLTRTVGGAGKFGLVILDACRNNPFAAKMARSGATRSVDRGFARVEPGDNVLVAYAARDGTTAKDGTGRNSPFTSALLRHIETPGLEVTFLFRNVRDEVMTATRREQQPFLYGSLSKEQIYLKVPADRIDQVTVRQPADPAAQAWAVTKDTASIAVLEDFIRQFGATVYASMARARIEELKRSQAAATAGAPSPSAASGNSLLGGLTDWLTRPAVPAAPPANPPPTAALASPAASPPSGAAGDCSGAAAHWNKAATAATRALFEEHVRLYPTCAFAALARSRIGATHVSLPPPSAPPVAAPAPRARPARADSGACKGASEHWNHAAVAGTSAAFQEHVQKYPNCAFSPLARNRLQSARAQGK